MNVLVQYPSFTGDPVGVWWLPIGLHWPRCYYLQAGSPQEIQGRQTMVNKVAGVTWPDYWAQLDDRAPYAPIWVLTGADEETWSAPAFMDKLLSIHHKKVS